MHIKIERQRETSTSEQIKSEKQSLKKTNKQTRFYLFKSNQLV